MRIERANGVLIGPRSRHAWSSVQDGCLLIHSGPAEDPQVTVRLTEAETQRDAALDGYNYRLRAVA
jgi:hypothetical protein